MLTKASDVISEKSFQASVVNMARAFDWIVGYTYDSRKSEPGEPDLRMVKAPWWDGPVLHAGRVIFAELKIKKGKYTKGRWNDKGRWLTGQDEWAEALKRCSGVEYYLWYPIDSDIIEEILRGSKPTS